MTKVRVQTILFGLVDGSFIRGVKECSDSLPFVLGGNHRSAGDPKKTFVPASRRDVLLDNDTPLRPIT